MVDYYPLLNRAIASLGQPDAAARASIYGRARDALQRQLRGFDPPLPEEEIRAQLETLEAVITRIEAEQDAAAAEPPPAPELPKVAPEPPPVPATDAPLPVPEDEPATPPPASPVIEPVLRPRMPSRDRGQRPAQKKLTLFVGIGIAAMLVMGVLALTRSSRPVAPPGPPVVTAPSETGSDPAKTEGRLAGAESQPAPAQPPAAPPPVAQAPAAPPAAVTSPASPPAGAVAASVGRAFMVLEPAPGVPNQFEGRVTWSYLPDTTIGGQKSLRALIEFSGSVLGIDFSIARNTDAGLNASHTVMVIFDGRNGLGNVLEMSAVEWREREDQIGGVLAGIVVPIQSNVFMIGLDKAEAAVTRNLSLLRTQKWMVFEFRLENGRRGAVLVEKSPGGDKSIADALRDWRQ